MQHFLFCRRQWALIHLEQQWQENFFTTDGEIFHEKAHQGLSFEKRKQVIISRGMPVRAQALGIYGVCDIVEFLEHPQGIALAGRSGTYQVQPVEYKRGKPKESPADIYQLVAQALCLEEMLCCQIPVSVLRANQAACCGGNRCCAACKGAGYHTRNARLLSARAHTTGEKITTMRHLFPQRCVPAAAPSHR